MLHQDAKKSASSVFPRRLDRTLPEAVKAEGLWIEDQSGNRYLDVSGGALVMNIGHGRDEMAAAVSAQIRACDYAHPTMFSHRKVEDLARALAGHAPAGIERFYFHCSGSEANEAAIKLARQIHLSAGRSQRQVLIGRWKSYHGLTLGALSAMGRTAFRTPYAPLLSGVVHIPPPYCLRCSFGLTFPECGLRCARALEEAIVNLGPETVSAFIAETVSGGTLAAYPPPPGYWPLVREICDRHGVLLILDEVMCGLGRTGAWYACQHDGIVPDMITLGKGLGGGAVALSALGVHQDHFDTVRAGGGSFVHGGTFTHHPVACAAGLCTVRILEREGLVERAAAMGRLLGERLTGALADHPQVADVRGVGLMWGIEFVRERATLTPFAREEQVAERLWESLAAKGLLVYRSTGLAGKDGDALLIGPSYIIAEKEIDHIVSCIESAVAEVFC